MTELSILIVSWNTADLLRQCLESIYRTLDGIACEVIVTDNCSSDATVAMLETDFPQVIVIQNSANTGFAAAMNTCLRRARGDYILWLNPDTVVRPGALDVMLGYARSLPGAGCLGPRITYGDGSLQRSAGRFPSVVGDLCELFYIDRLFPRSSRIGGYTGTYTATREVDWVSGACLMMPRELTETVGRLDERFFMYTEEIDYCFRVKAAGRKNYFLPDAEIVHLEGKSAEHRPVWAITALHKSKFLFKAKYSSGAVLWGARTAALTGIFFRLAVFSLAYVFSGSRRHRLGAKLRAHARLFVWHLKGATGGAGRSTF